MVVCCVYQLGQLVLEPFLGIFPEIIFEAVLMLFCGTILNVGEVTSDAVKISLALGDRCLRK